MFKNKGIKVIDKLRSIIDARSFEDIYSKLVKVQSNKIDIFNQNNQVFDELYLKSENIFQGKLFISIAKQGCRKLLTR